MVQMYICRIRDSSPVSATDTLEMITSAWVTHDSEDLESLFNVLCFISHFSHFVSSIFQDVTAPYTA
jgi:hypothetical protein